MQNMQVIGIGLILKESYIALILIRWL